MSFDLPYWCISEECCDFSNYLMMTSSNGNILRLTGPLWWEFAGHRWIPLTKASDVELWCFLWSPVEQTVEQTIEIPVIWDAITLIMTSLLCNIPHENMVQIHFLLSLALLITLKLMYISYIFIFIITTTKNRKPRGLCWGHSSSGNTDI